MTEAKQLIQDYEKGTVKSIAREALKRGGARDSDANMVFWRMPDGSCVGTRGRGKRYQYWECGKIAL